MFKQWGARIMIVAVVLGLTAVNATADDLAGQWSGSWRSCSSGHQGPLNASICKLNDECYRADFKGRFFKFVPFKYSVTLNVVSRDGDVLHLAGSSYLGRIMGWFHYTATVENGCLSAHYRSCKDNGTWTLRKCCH